MPLRKRTGDSPDLSSELRHTIPFLYILKVPPPYSLEKSNPTALPALPSDFPASTSDSASPKSHFTSSPLNLFLFLCSHLSEWHRHPPCCSSPESGSHPFRLPPLSPPQSQRSPADFLSLVSLKAIHSPLDYYNSPNFPSSSSLLPCILQTDLI